MTIENVEKIKNCLLNHFSISEIQDYLNDLLSFGDDIAYKNLSEKQILDDYETYRLLGKEM